MPVMLLLSRGPPLPEISYALAEISKEILKSRRKSGNLFGNLGNLGNLVNLPGNHEIFGEIRKSSWKSRNLFRNPEEILCRRGGSNGRMRNTYAIVQIT